MDETELSVGNYSTFAERTGRSIPPHEQEDLLLPVTRVTWNDARAYARWVGGDLPSEIQWLAAAMGRDRRVYPWGSEESPSGIRLSGSGSLEVDASPNDEGPYGHLGLGGNVREFCRDVFREDWPCEGVSRGHEYVVRGGSYATGIEGAANSVRHQVDGEEPHV